MSYFSTYSMFNKFLLVSFLIFLNNLTIAQELPDMAPSVYDLSLEHNQVVDSGDVVEGCAAAETGRSLLRFSMDSINFGLGDLNLGDPKCPDCYEQPGLTCENPLFECSGAGGHGHAHALGFADYELVNSDGVDVVVGHKEGFCLVDSYCFGDQEIIYDPEEPACAVLHAGCADVYPSGIGCQYLDVTGISSGDYILRVTLNSERKFAEADFSNNRVELPIKICNPRKNLKVQISAPQGEEGERRLQVSAKVPFKGNIKKFNPKKTGLNLSLIFDSYTALSLDIPAGGPKQSCAPGEGWFRKSQNEWTFINKYGSTGVNCDGYIAGVNELNIKVDSETKSLTISMMGSVPLSFITGEISSASLTLNIDSLSGVQALGCNSSMANSCRRAGLLNKGYACSNR